MSSRARMMALATCLWCATPASAQPAPAERTIVVLERTPRWDGQVMDALTSHLSDLDVPIVRRGAKTLDACHTPSVLMCVWADAKAMRFAFSLHGTHKVLARPLPEPDALERVEIMGVIARAVTRALQRGELPSVPLLEPEPVPVIAIQASRQPTRGALGVPSARALTLRSSAKTLRLRDTTHLDVSLLGHRRFAAPRRTTPAGLAGARAQLSRGALWGALSAHLPQRFERRDGAVRWDIRRTPVVAEAGIRRSLGRHEVMLGAGVEVARWRAAVREGALLEEDGSRASEVALRPGVGWSMRALGPFRVHLDLAARAELVRVDFVVEDADGASSTDAERVSGVARVGLGVRW